MWPKTDEFDRRYCDTLRRRRLNRVSAIMTMMQWDIRFDLETLSKTLPFPRERILRNLMLYTIIPTHKHTLEPHPLPPACYHTHIILLHLYYYRGIYILYRGRPPLAVIEPSTPPPPPTTTCAAIVYYIFRDPRRRPSVYLSVSLPPVDVPRPISRVRL